MAKTSDACKRRDELIAKLRAVGQQALDDGFNKADVKELLLNSVPNPSQKRNNMLFYSVVTVMVACLVGGSIATWDPRCIVANNLLLMELSRPGVSCDVCKNISRVPTVDGDTFSKEEFLRDYAYNGIPLLVKGGAKNWTALTTFNFNYLKDLFEQTEGALEAVEFDCQFFPYKTSFLTLAEVFNMSAARSRIDEGEQQWYVGW